MFPPPNVFFFNLLTSISVYTYDTLYYVYYARTCNNQNFLIIMLSKDLFILFSSFCFLTKVVLYYMHGL